MIKEFRRAGLLSLFMMLLSLSLQAQVSVPEELVAYPDFIIHNAKIVTMSDASLNDSPGKIVEAMAVRGDAIQFIGSNQQVLSYAGPKTRKIDLKGRTVVPGLMNTHTHWHNGAVSEYFRKHPEKIEALVRQFSVTGKSFGEITKGIELVLKENMANPLPGQWAFINVPQNSTGTELGPEYIRNQGMTAAQLDVLAPNTPAVLMCSSCSFIVNTAARKDIADIFMLDPDDTEEDINSDTAVQTVFGRTILMEKYFGEHLEELADLLENDLKEKAAGGFTTYSSHMQGLMFMPAFQKLVREDRMPIRFGFAYRYCAEFNADMAGCFRRHGDWAGMGNKYFWSVGTTLGAIDGAPPNFCTKAVPRPEYKDRVLETCQVRPGSPYYEAIYTILRSRMRLAVNHSWADGGLDTVMDIMERVMQENPNITLDFMRSLRVSADHCGLMPRPDQLPRIKKLGMIISCGANNMNRAAPWIKVFGEDKADWTNPIKNMLNAGVMPTSEGEGGADVTPMYANLVRMTRKTETGEIVGPKQAIDRVSAIKMQTIWAAYYVLKEKELGSLEPGKLADFVVFNKDYFTVPPDDIPTVFPLMTVLGGETMMLRAELAKELGIPQVGTQKQWKFKPEVNPDFLQEIRASGE